MDYYLISFIIRQVILLAIIVFYIYLIMKIDKSESLNRRLNKYSLSNNSNSISLFDYYFVKLINFIEKLNKLFSKSILLTNYSKRYEKYIDIYESNYKSGMDFVSVKFLFSIVISLFYIISSFMWFKFNFMFLLLLFLVTFFIVDIYYYLEYKSRRKRIENDLLSAIIIMNNAFKSGRNIMQAVEMVSMELDGAIKSEFKKIYLDISYGLNLEIVFNRFYERVKIEDIKYISSSLALINKTGGNVVKVFNSIEKNFYDKKQIKDEVNSLTSSSNFMFKLLLFVPILLIFIIVTLSPSFFSPLLLTNLGRIILLLIIILYVIYIIIVKKIIRVDE